MGFDLEERKTLLYADLFKPCITGGENQNATRRKYEAWSTSSNWSSTLDSSSSGFSTPLGSELGSSEIEDGDFVAELSRQMAECMLQEEEEEVTHSVTDSSAVNGLKCGLNSSYSVWDADRNRKPCLELKNQLRVSKQVPDSQGRRVNGAELTQQMQFQKTEQNFGRYRERGWRRKGHLGSGMRAIFLGGSGSGNGSTGTGVFLPRVDNRPLERKKKSGLSTVLIPTRVLHALELHFNSLSDSSTPTVASPRDEWIQARAANKDENMQILPQEWTY